MERQEEDVHFAERRGAGEGDRVPFVEEGELPLFRGSRADALGEQALLLLPGEGAAHGVHRDHLVPGLPERPGHLGPRRERDLPLP